jgi:isoaspartyl peptidase/L-asparaginase-like protein (Ntn-hydrolase superfamily)
MTGDKRYGAIASLVGVRNPIRIARAMVDDQKFSILVGQGALDFARSLNVPILPPASFKTDFNAYIRDTYAWHSDPLDAFVAPDHGTVGCVVRDIRGNIAAGTSTGGTPFAPAGRVGDSPFPGCGLWADDEDGAASATGYGEAILVELLSARAAQRCGQGTAQEAAEGAIRRWAKGPRTVGGVIVISKKTGEYGICHNTATMPFAMVNDDETITAAVRYGGDE